MEVYRKPDGKLGLKVLGTISQVKDECKEQKIGRCGSSSWQSQRPPHYGAI